MLTDNEIAVILISVGTAISAALWFGYQWYLARRRRKVLQKVAESVSADFGYGWATDHCLQESLRSFIDYSESPAGRDARQQMFMDPDETENPHS